MAQLVKLLFGILLAFCSAWEQLLIQLERVEMALEDRR